ncbi:NAD(P)/FAD-dependent oxidoreductase [Natronogracilivirga saccharolytica]|uniref:FAD-binding oxidoreductase n=1 Tax=Natronogracilivirga saccharolytica TaxID=2812953 RepID=A0A8J7UVU2_9BACT|nr:FAD-dependent oxidoreductase [Natronogracilivirga saccharolytica]MBP3192931.1 FAD-binding oxidoreductase [Natronogracilivirga saccharolytica]
MEKFDVIVIGGGLAGLATAAQLIEKNKKLRILVHEAREVGQGASGVPGAMVNPATGQRARIAWNAESCMHMLEERLKRVSAYTDEKLWTRNGVLRPAIDEALSENFRNALKRSRWPKGWVEWLQPDAVSGLVPRLKDQSGGLFIRKGMVVQTPEYLNACVRYLQEQGVQFQYGGPYQLERERNWTLTSFKKQATAPTVILTAGYKSRENKYWNELPLNSVKGQLAIYECQENVSDLPAISAYGYIAPISRNRLVVGSTYEHHFHDENPDDQGAGLLDQKLNELLPDLYTKCRRIGQWSGIRATTPDRIPLVGEHYSEKGLYIFAGLGSKGLLYSECIAAGLAEHLIRGEKLPKELSLFRFSKLRDLREQAAEE